MQGSKPSAYVYRLVEGLSSRGTRSTGLWRVDASRGATNVRVHGGPGRGLGLHFGGCESRICDMYGVCYCVTRSLDERLFSDPGMTGARACATRPPGCGQTYSRQLLALWSPYATFIFSTWLYSYAVMKHQYIPSVGSFVPIENLLPLFPALTYQLFFDRKTGEAIGELDKDIRRSLRATLRTMESPPPEAFLQSRDSFLGAWDSVAEVRNLLHLHGILNDEYAQIDPIPFFSPEEEDYFVEQFSIQGFRNSGSTLSHYYGRNLIHLNSLALGFYSTKAS